MSALRPAFFILYLESYISRLNEILRHDLTLSVGEPDNAAAQTGAGTAFGVNGDHEQGLCLFTRFALQNLQKEDKNGYLLSIINNFHIHSRDFFLSL